MITSAGLGPEAIPDKADVMLYGDYQGRTALLGVVHVKASLAERRTDDVPMSRALVQAGFFSPLWTLDGKANVAAPIVVCDFSDPDDAFSQAIIAAWQAKSPAITWWTGSPVSLRTSIQTTFKCLRQQFGYLLDVTLQ